MWLVFGLRVPEIFKNKPHRHIPLIETRAVVFNPEKALLEASDQEALLFTSQEGAFYFKAVLEKLPKGKKVFCVGPKTAEAVKKFYMGPLYIPETYDQEGLVSLVKLHLPSSLYYPKAKITRSYLEEALCEMEIPCTYQVIYETRQKVPDDFPKEVPSGYFFSSPSSVSAFKALGIPLHEVPIWVQGKVTREALQKELQRESLVQQIPQDLSRCLDKESLEFCIYGGF